MGFHKWQPEDFLDPWKSLVDGEDARGGGGVHLFKDCSGRSLDLVIGVSADGQIELVG